jgi:dCTP diphosphatase
MDIKDILDRYNELCEDNDWQVFHTPKNLASALSVSSAHILEHFQWVTEEESFTLGRIPEPKEKLTTEMAELFFQLLALSDKLGIDLEQAIKTKLAQDQNTHRGVPDDLEDTLP